MKVQYVPLAVEAGSSSNSSPQGWEAAVVEHYVPAAEEREPLLQQGCRWEPKLEAKTQLAVHNRNNTAAGEGSSNNSSLQGSEVAVVEPYMKVAETMLNPGVVHR